jgi:uncharacterized protein YggE
MKTLTALSLPAIALLALAAPAQAGKSDAGNEVALHIDADAAIPPDRAEMNLPLVGKGATREEALRDYAAKQAAITSGLVAAGIDRAGIRTSEAKDDKDAAGMAAMEAAEAADAAAEPLPAAKAGAKRAPITAVSGSMTITINDLKLLDKLQEVARTNELPLYQLSGGGRFYSSDPAAANRAAREQAIAKARSEADGYASAMGYHVVRLTHVSNASPPFNMRDLQKIASYADMARNTLQPSFFASAAYATVSIDFVIAPN